MTTARVVLIEKGAMFLDDGGCVVVPKRLRRGGTVPAVGDHVIVDGGKLQQILPRRTKLSRKAPGQRLAEQVVAANIDKVFILCGLDGDYNPRRIERYLVATRSGGAEPIVLLNKADGCPDAQERAAEVERLGVRTLVLSALTGAGVEALPLVSGETVCFVGSSGAGKSTLLNRLLGADVQRTRAVREDDDRGRHTTSSRELFALPGGAFVIDTPGMREVGLWEAEEGMASSFQDVESLAQECRFRDCRHDGEPGCAVAAAVADGRLAEGRLADWRKLTTEVDLQAKKRWAKSIARIMKRHKPR